MHPLRVATLLALAACTDQALPVISGPIETEAEFRSTVVGKTITSDLAQVIIRPNGTITGVSDGQPIAGIWEFRDGLWCRTITQPVPVAEDCQAWVVRGRTLILTRGAGAGPQLEFLLPAT